MALPSTSTNVRALAGFYECQSLSTSRNLAGGIGERDQQLIANELGNRVNEAQRRDKASENSPPPIPPRPNRPVTKKADTAIASYVEENGEEIGDSQYTLSEEEKPGPRRVDTTQGLDPQELEQQAQQAHQKTQELTVQLTGCKTEIQRLNDQIITLKEAAARGRQILDSESREQQSPGDSNSEAPRIQPGMTRRSLRDVALMREQQRQNDRLERQNRALARAGSAARTEAENARRELARLQKEKEKKKKHKVQKRGLYRNKDGVIGVLAMSAM